MPIDRLVFIDEAGCNTGMARRYARSSQGRRAHGSQPFGWGPNVTMIGALSLEGLLTLMTITGGTTGEVFLAFVRQFLVPELRPGDVVVLDNLSAHKVVGVREAIQQAGAQVVYLPPYSPDFNPIEPCWSKVKTYLRARAARTREELEDAIAEAMDLVTSSDADGWFEHCGYAESL